MAEDRRAALGLVAADPLEDAGAVVQAVAEHVHLGVLPAHELAVVPNQIRLIHVGEVCPIKRRASPPRAANDAGNAREGGAGHDEFQIFVPKLSYSNVIATIALFVALGGAAVAAGLPKNSVGPKQLKRGAVTTAKTAQSRGDQRQAGAEVGRSPASSAPTRSCPATSATAPSTSAKIGAGAVIASSIKNGVVTTNKLNNDAVTTPKLANGSVTNPILANGSVTPTKLERRIRPDASAR